MNDENVKIEDYGDFAAAVATTEKLNANLETDKQSVETCKSSLQSADVFWGPAADSIDDGLQKLSNLVTLITENFGTMASLLTQVGDKFKTADSDAMKFISATKDGKFEITTGPALIPSGNETQDEAYLYLKRKNYSDAAICGILSNIEYESGFQTAVDGDGGQSHGLCQWYSGRNQDLRDYCKKNNYELDSVEGQLSFMEWELENNPRFAEVNEVVKNAPNTKEGAYDVAHIWTTTYEVPENAQSKALDRADTAQNKYWDLYGPK